MLSLQTGVPSHPSGRLATYLGLGRVSRVRLVEKRKSKKSAYLPTCIHSDGITVPKVRTCYRSVCDRSNAYMLHEPIARLG